MQKTEFLQELREALQGEVSPNVIQENLSYYDTYISGEAAKGRTEEEVIEEIGGPRLIARTIIDSSDAAGASTGTDAYGSRSGTNDGDGTGQGPMQYHSVDLSKWYWKVIISAVLIVVLLLVFTVLGGIFSLAFRFAGPLILIWLVFSLFKGPRR